MTSTNTSAAATRIASAPISWGISEVDDWGVQLSPSRVLSEMRELGFSATEIGPDGFLPPVSADKVKALAAHHLSAVGSFLPVVAHTSEVDPLPRVLGELDDYAAVGADVLIVCAVERLGQGYDEPLDELTSTQWNILLRNLSRIDEAARERGMNATVHPHVGSLVETPQHIERVLRDSSISFCFDTGHLMIGGTDPVDFARKHAARIAHMHLKDVAVQGMQQVKSGALSYYDAISADKLYRPLGQGDVDIRSIVDSMLASGYTGWFVLEQDKVVAEMPGPGEGPIVDARESVAYLRRILEELEAVAS